MVGCEFDCRLFLCEAAQSGQTSWHFMDELSLVAGVPAAAISLVESFCEAVEDIGEEARALRRGGMIGHSLQMDREAEALRVQRVEAPTPWVSLPTVPRAPPPPPPPRAWDAAAVAAALHASHHCVIDGFGEAGGSLRAALVRMHARGELGPGEIAAGQSRATRGDVMRWVAAGASEPPAISSFLASLDELVGALCRSPLLASDLGAATLWRHEVQATCYPADGARYVRHVDDAC